MKGIIIKSAIVLVAWSVVGYIQNTIAPMMTADMAVTQLQDSDFAYAQWEGWKNIINNLWVAYLLPLLLFITDIKKLIK